MMHVRVLPFVLISLCLARAGVAEEASSYHGVYRELPITAITPNGWLAELLQRQHDGLAMQRKGSGHPFDTDLWVGKIPHAHWADWEQAAYFVDGAYRCGLILHDEALTALGRQNVDYVLTHPQSNGMLGPSPDDFIKPMVPDGVNGPVGMGTQWPFAVFTRALMAHYSATRDKRVVEALTKHYLALPDDFGGGPRDVENVEGMCWLYGQTGDSRIQKIAERTWRVFESSKANARKQWTLDNLSARRKLQGHGVTVAETTKQPALLFLATGEQRYLDAAVGGFTRLQQEHEQINGVLSSDASTSGKAPDHQNETCVITDYTWGLGYLSMATGDARWADTIERAILNAGLGVIDREFKALQYYGAPNQVVATQTCNHPTTGTKNRSLQAYRPDHGPECCTGNIERQFPNYVSRLWLGDGKGGLAALMYAPCTLKTKVGAGSVPVTITQQTDYPFGETIRLKINCAEPVDFPLHLRIPGWAQGATVSVNGKANTNPKPGTFAIISRTFNDGDEVVLTLPMRPRLETTAENGVSVVRGPLVYVLKIDTKRTKLTKTRAKEPILPAWDEVPISAWNYALALKGDDELKQLRTEIKPLGDEYPWTPETAPVVLIAPAKQIPSWQLTPAGETPPLPSPGVKQSDETAQVQLIPYGATHLRVSVFPRAK
ncbi:MAG TPA: beta-L-arabinofuranosidase domain-containing protein [Tepidisphaeraceae bacterium]|jgi:hypothetical protein|nr:beta-L-arabinofuranosidase domain-containing protein [Tepidisphaeraceae bacterium]